MTGTGKATVETLQRLLDAYSAHDLDAVMSFFGDDAVLEMPRGPDPWGRRLQGRGGGALGAGKPLRRPPRLEARRALTRSPA